MGPMFCNRTLSPISYRILFRLFFLVILALCFSILFLMSSSTLISGLTELGSFVLRDLPKNLSDGHPVPSEETVVFIENTISFRCNVVNLSADLLMQFLTDWTPRSAR